MTRRMMLVTRVVCDEEDDGDCYKSNGNEGDGQATATRAIDGDGDSEGNNVGDCDGDEAGGQQRGQGQGRQGRW